ncbi:zeta-carotene isomerase [Chloropicon primus]|nr:zeta-carotene isomerase [Chloropicon primus]UPR03874.1 zeta-carotene isomerase [Chloropicon primus]|eukprot:QDZ24666.1 zeta-carotene isomerase [Chloropicon primus]
MFEWSEESPRSWFAFFSLLAVVFAGLYVAWIDPDSGMGTPFVDAVESISSNHELVMMILLVIFGVAHSGLAALRPAGEKLVGERAYRVGFALVSLPLALTTVMYFINHRYSGIPLYDLRDVPGVHETVWLLSFASFFFLYPSTFNILEVAAVDVPKVHLWETGVIRITRHPQMVGQVLWSLAHCLWMGNSFAWVTSFGLCAYHLFGCWHGDRRLQSKFGEDFEELEKRTSVWPFVAILQGRQKLPPDYWREWMRVPYAAVTIFTLGAYVCHPLMQRFSYWLDW